MTARLAKRICLGALLLGLILGVMPASHADSIGAQVFQRSLKSTCFIVMLIPEKGRTLIRMGTGSVIDAKKRIVLTNYHVIAGQTECAVLFPDFDKSKELIVDKKKYFERLKNRDASIGKVLHQDSSRDLAVIQLDKLPKGIIPFKLAEKSPGPGSSIHSVGNPGTSDALWIYTPGEVRSMYRKNYKTGPRDDPNGGFEIDCNILETTSPTNEGDSGGPLLNDKGELVAVTQGYQASGGRAVSYFVDVSEVRAFLKGRKIDLTDQPATGGIGKGSKTDVASDTEEPKQQPKTEVKTTAATGPSAETEKKADSKLTAAKSLLDAGKRETALKWFKEVLDKYPETKAAKEAKELLEKNK